MSYLEFILWMVIVTQCKNICKKDMHWIQYILYLFPSRKNMQKSSPSPSQRSGTLSRYLPAFALKFPPRASEICVKLILWVILMAELEPVRQGSQTRPSSLLSRWVGNQTERPDGCQVSVTSSLASTEHARVNEFQFWAWKKGGKEEMVWVSCSL